jgi:hypothetical protein
MRNHKINSNEVFKSILERNKWHRNDIVNQCKMGENKYKKIRSKLIERILILLK